MGKGDSGEDDEGDEGKGEVTIVRVRAQYKLQSHKLLSTMACDRHKTPHSISSTFHTSAHLQHAPFGAYSEDLLLSRNATLVDHLMDSGTISRICVCVCGTSVLV